VTAARRWFDGRRTAVAAAATVLLLTAAGRSYAQVKRQADGAPVPIAHRGAWVAWANQGVVIGTGSRAYVGFESIDGRQVGRAGLRLSLDRFLTDWWSVGLLVDANLAHGRFIPSRVDTVWQSYVGPRLGLFLPGGDQFGFWPTVTGVVGVGDGRTIAGFDVTVPVVVQASPRFLLAVGPLYQERFDSGPGSHSRGYGLQLALGGTFPAEQPRAPMTGEPRQRFGQEGQWVLGAAHGRIIPAGSEAAGLQTRQFGRTNQLLVLVATLDRFLSEQLSLGFSLGVVSGSEDGAAATTATLVGVQGGVAISVGDQVVLWPKAALQWILGKYVRSTNIHIFVPLAMELDHLLLGLGPILEGSSLAAKSEGSTLGTGVAVGLSLLFAGWWD
jgi:hypothetical protein